MPNPDSADVHVTGQSKPKPTKLSNQQLAAILNRLAELMAANEPTTPASEDSNNKDTKPDKSETQKPYPNEHAARQADPGQYSEIRRKNNAFGTGIHVIYGVKNGKTEVQSIRFASSNFSAAEAKKWLTEHEYSAGQFEAATEVAKQANIADLLISIIHRHFTEEADLLYGNGQLSQDERILLSNAIGDALDVFNQRIDEKLMTLRTRSQYMDSTGLAKQIGTCCECGKETTVQMIESKPYCATCAAEESDDDESETEDESETTKSDVAIIAKQDEKRIAYGVAYPAKPLGWSDTQGDWISTEEIENMAHAYMLKSQQYDIEHERIAAPDEAQIVESYIAPVDFTFNGHTITKGSWVVATHFPNPTTWANVKSGVIKAYSIKGRGKRKPLKV